MGETYIIVETGDTVVAKMYADATALVYELTGDSSVFDDPFDGTFGADDPMSGYYEWKHFELQFVDGDTGEVTVRDAYYSDEFPLTIPLDYAEAAIKSTAMGGDRSDQNKLEYLRLEGDPALGMIMYGTGFAVRGAMEGCSDVEEAEAPSIAYTEVESTLLISSLADSVNIGDETGLITQGTFRVHWNQLDNRENWDDGTKHQYNSIEDGEVSGSIFLQKEIYQDGETKFFSYSPINAGPDQRDPTFREKWALDPTFGVFYGRVEENAIKDKYAAYSGDLSQYISDSLDKLVGKAAAGLNQSKSKYTFKRIDTNRKFKKINTSAFAKDKRAEEPESVEASTTRVEEMPPPSDSGAY